MASNLNPKTAGYTTTGVILSAEPFPSAVEAALANNTGYNLYRPVRGHEYTPLSGSFTDSNLGTSSLLTNYVYFGAGVYDVEVRINGSFTTTGNIGTVYLYAGGTLVSNYYAMPANGGSTFAETVSAITLSSGWHSMYLYSFQPSNDTVTIYNANTFFRQYR